MKEFEEIKQIIAGYDGLALDRIDVEVLKGVVNYVNELQQKNTNLKQALNEIREYCNDDNEYWGNDDYINGKNEGISEVKKDILQIIEKAGGNEE